MFLSHFGCSDLTRIFCEGLVHDRPKSIELHILQVGLDLSLPEAHALLVEPVKIDNRLLLLDVYEVTIGVLGVDCRLNKSIGSLTSLVDWVLSAILHVDTGIDVSNELLLSVMEGLSQRGNAGELSLIELEVDSLIPGVGSKVEGINGETLLHVSCRGLSDTVLISTLVRSLWRGFLPAEGPERNKLWEINHSLVGLDNFMSGALT